MSLLLKTKQIYLWSVLSVFISSKDVRKSAQNENMIDSFSFLERETHTISA